jgi:hypothetical protein
MSCLKPVDIEIADFRYPSTPARHSLSRSVGLLALLSAIALPNVLYSATLTSASASTYHFGLPSSSSRPF